MYCLDEILVIRARGNWVDARVKERLHHFFMRSEIIDWFWRFRYDVEMYWVTDDDERAESGSGCERCEGGILFPLQLLQSKNH